MDIAAAWKPMEEIRRPRWEQSIYPAQRQVPETYPKSDENATYSHTINQ